MLPGRLRRQGTSPNLFFHPRMIVGDLGQVLIAQDVNAAVTDVRDTGVLGAVEDGGRGRRHAAQVGVAADHVAQSILFAYKLPQNVLIQEICITPTRQGY